MRFEWPKCTRCCCCLPLRRGVITFGYLNIACSIMIIITFILVQVWENPHRPHYAKDYHGPLLRGVKPEIDLILSLLELLFNVVLLYGAHKKIPKYIKAYFYCGMTTTVASVVMQIIELTDILESGIWFSTFLVILIFIFIATCIQVYLLSLCWTLVKKLEKAGPHHFDNKLHEIIVPSNTTENYSVTDEQS